MNYKGKYPGDIQNGRPIPVTARSMVYVSSRSLAGVAGSNSTGNIEVSLF